MNTDRINNWLEEVILDQADDDELFILAQMQYRNVTDAEVRRLMLSLWRARLVICVFSYVSVGFLLLVALLAASCAPVDPDLDPLADCTNLGERLVFLYEDCGYDVVWDEYDYCDTYDLYTLACLVDGLEHDCNMAVSDCYD